MDPFVFMIYLLAFGYLMVKFMDPTASSCPDCGGGGEHFPNCPRVTDGVRCPGCNAKKPKWERFWLHETGCPELAKSRGR